MINLLWIILILFYKDVECNAIERTATTTIVQSKELAYALQEVTEIFKIFQSWTKSFEAFKKRFKKAYNKFIEEAFYVEDSHKETASLSDILKDESKMETYQLIVHHGNKVESHNVETKDGYTLRLFRLISPIDNSTTENEVLLLLHGLMGSSDDWLLLGPGIALPYMLLDTKCDVWLPNFRGNKYSNIHVSKKNNTPDFWNFSFHEMGTEDLKAIIDYVNKTTGGKSNITLIGHSLGATAILVLLSTQPQYNHILKSAIFLAPLSFMYDIKGPLKVYADRYSYVLKKFKSLAFFGVKKFMDINFPPEIVQQFCRGDELTCSNPLLLIANGGKMIHNQNLLRNVMGHTDVTSARTIYHYIQLINSGKFQNIDYGEEHNMKVYGTKNPPAYQIRNVTLPIYVFSARDDWLATTMNVMNLVVSLRNVVSNNIIQRKGFTHTDFLWSEEAPNLLYKHITAIVKGNNTINTSREINFI